MDTGTLDEDKGTGTLTEDMDTGTLDEGKDSGMNADEMMKELHGLAKTADLGLKCMMGFMAGLEVADRPVPEALSLVRERLLEVRNGCMGLRVRLEPSAKKSGAGVVDGTAWEAEE